MSKDIWHTKDETPEKFRDFVEHFKTTVIDRPSVNYGIFNNGSCACNPFDEKTIRWCYLDDLLALETELERTRKALDKAKWWLNEIVENHRFTPISTAEMALKEITALEQKDK